MGTNRHIDAADGAKSFEISKRFYIDLGFQPRSLTDNLIEKPHS
jgi:hypothetical protein